MEHQNILVCAPHADDEILGLGGTLLKHLAAGDNVYIAFITHPKTEFGFTKENDAKRISEIEACMSELGVKDENYRILGYQPANLNYSNLGQLIDELRGVIGDFDPKIIYIPHHEDTHSDHYFAAKAIDALSKSFRSPSIKKVISYETMSETDISLLNASNFKPNIFVNIDDFIEKKIDLLQHYPDEMGRAPFPRSPEIIRAHAIWRGSQAGYRFAEAHRLLVCRDD